YVCLVTANTDPGGSARGVVPAPIRQLGSPENLEGQRLLEKNYSTADPKETYVGRIFRCGPQPGLKTRPTYHRPIGVRSEPPPKAPAPPRTGSLGGGARRC